MKKLFILLMVCSIGSLYGQSIGIGTETPHSSAALDVASSDQGILIPRTDTASITSPANGLLIFQNSDLSFYYFNGGWKKMGSASDQIQDTDNDTKVQVESTPDDDNIRFISKNVEVMSHDGKTLEMKNNGQSVFIGEQAGSNDDLSDNKNVFIGYRTGENNTTGVQNNAIGNQALNANTTGSNNISVGPQSLFKNNGSNNIALGLNASKENTSGAKNISVGNFANFANQDGTDNVAIGDESGRGNAFVSKSGNVFVGSRSGKKTETDGNVAIGRDALTNNINGSDNVAIGDSAMHLGAGSNLLDFGSDNVAIGKNAGKANSNGRKNTFIGKNAAKSNTSGSFNTSVGYESAASQNGSHNTMLGFQSGEGVTSGISNVMLGSESGGKSTTGESNIFIGRRAAFVNTSGNKNIVIGQEAGQENREGNSNLYIGHHAGRNVFSGSGNIYIGNEAGKDEQGNNQLIIGNSANLPLIEGKLDSLTTRVNGELSINDPDSTGYSFPEEDGEVGSILKSDGEGNAYWYEPSAPPTTDADCGVAYNFEAVPVLPYEYYFDIDGVPGESITSNYVDLIVGYGLDYSYNNPSNTTGGSTTPSCLNMSLSIRKAADIASPDLFLKSIQSTTISEAIFYQVEPIGGVLKEKMKFTLTDMVVTNIRHETFYRDNGTYSTYEVLDLSFDKINIEYLSYDVTGNPTGANHEMTFDCILGTGFE